jgi:SAM-dependent methyltransferase
VKKRNIDNEREFDWGKTSQDYAAYRSGYPESFYEVLAALGIGKPGQRILDLGTGTGVLARAFAQRGSVVTREAWQGRIRASRGIGASLPAEDVEKFDAEHGKLLEAIAPPTFAVPHQMTIHVYVRKAATTVHRLLENAYRAFNARAIDSALATMHADVEWPNGMEGGSVHGHMVFATTGRVSGA